ncbi:MAG: hypothetical protein ABEH56_06430 [Salinirussus sp.]
MTSRRALLGLALAVAVALSGCGALLGGAGADAEPTLTPAPVPATGTATPAPSQNGRALAGSRADTRDHWAGVSDRSTQARPEAPSLQPTCDRGPGSVVHLQVAALRNGRVPSPSVLGDDAASVNRGHPDAVALLAGRFRPVLGAERVDFGRLERDGDTAVQRLRVRTGTGRSLTYDWRLERLPGESGSGCWTTVGIAGPE